MRLRHLLVLAAIFAGSFHAGLRAQGTAAKPALPTTAGPLVYTYCFVTQDVKTYVSAVFQVHGQEPGMPTAKYRGILYAGYAMPYKQYLDDQYDVPRQNPSSYGCEDGFAVRSVAEAKRAEFVANYSHSANKNAALVETPWKGSGADALPIEVPDAPDQVSRDLKKYIGRERPMYAPYCEKNVMSHLMDCGCVADTIYAARVKGPTKVDGTRLSPQLPLVITNTNFEACASAEKITKYSADRVQSTFPTAPDVTTLKACVAPKMVTQIEANATSLTRIAFVDGYFMQDVMACRAGH